MNPISYKMDYNTQYSILQIKKLKSSYKYVVALSNLGVYYTWKNIRTSYKNNKYQLQHRIINLNYLMDLILCQMFKIIPVIPSKNMQHLLIIFKSNIY